MGTHTDSVVCISPYLSTTPSSRAVYFVKTTKEKTPLRATDSFEFSKLVMDDFTGNSVIVDRDSNRPRALLKQHFRSPLANLYHLLFVARVMDGRGVLPTLSPDDVETAAQVPSLALSPPASH